MTEQRLAAIERAQERTNVLLTALSEKMDDRIDQTDERMGRIGRVMWGDNGHADSPGLLVRLDRLEQYTERLEKAYDRSRWLVRAVVTSVVGLIGAAVLGF